MEEEVKKIKVEFTILAGAKLLKHKNHLIYGNKVQYFTDEERQKLIQELDVVIYELNKIINYLNRD